MPEALLSIAAVCALFVLSQLSPGPDVIFVFRTALARGFRGGVAVSSGIMLGFALQTLLVMTAGAWLTEQSWSRWVLLAAGLWLAYLAWKIFPRPRENGAGQGDALAGGDNGADSLSALLGQGFLCNILNPKCTLFIAGLTLAPLQQYAAVYPWFTVVFFVAVLAANWAGWCSYCALLQWHPVRAFYTGHTRGIDGVFSVLLALFALLLIAQSLLAA